MAKYKNTKKIEQKQTQLVFATKPAQRMVNTRPNAKNKYLSSASIESPRSLDGRY